MYRWNCMRHGCTHSVWGVGGAIGLRAIGWYFVPGPFILCPGHRPDPVPCADQLSEGNHGKDCSLCAAELQAEPIQSALQESDPDWPAGVDGVPHRMPAPATPAQ